jgi:hypothetical protein
MISILLMETSQPAAATIAPKQPMEARMLAPSVDGV